MKKLGRSMLGLALALIMALSMVPVLPEVQAASVQGYIAITVLNAEGQPKASKRKFLYKSEKGKVNTVSGLKYSEKTNTLTIKNYNHPRTCIIVYAMGKDFKVKVVGKNKIQTFMSLAEEGKKRCGVYFQGSGRLVINQNLRSQHGIQALADYTKSRLHFAKSVKVRSYSDDDPHAYAVVLFDSKYTSQGITYSGSLKYAGTIKKAKIRKGIYTYVFNRRIFWKK